MLIIAPCSLVNRLKNFSKKSHFFLDDSYLSKLERMYHIWMFEAQPFLYREQEIPLKCTHLYVCVCIYILYM